MRFARELVIRAFIQTCNTARDDGRTYAVVPEECRQYLEPGEQLPLRNDMCGLEWYNGELAVSFICLRDFLHSGLCGFETPTSLQYAL